MGRIRKTTLQGRTKQNSDYRFFKISEPVELLTAPTTLQLHGMDKIDDCWLKGVNAKLTGRHMCMPIP
jgi:hypothetical protein